MYNPYQQGNFQNQGYSQYGQGYPMQQQATGFYQQPPQNSGYAQPQQPGLFQGQQTGYQQQLQSQQTGFQGQQAPQAQASFQQPQQTGYGFQGYQPMGAQATGYAQQQQQPTQQLQAQKTGFSAALSGVKQNHELHIPEIRLSFISAADQTKFENLFRTAVASGENAISGDAARDILLRSGLSPVTLAEVWALADTNKSGALLFPEFALALHLCNSALKGERLPGLLPEKWSNEVQSFVDAISFSVPEDPNKILANTPFSSYAQQQSSSNDWLAQTSSQNAAMAPVAAPQTSFTAQPTGGFQSANALSAQRTGGGSLIPLQPQQTSSFVPASQPLQAQRTGPMPAQLTGFQSNPQLTAQRTGPLPPTSFQAQPTGGLMPPSTSFQSQPTGGFQPQQTGGFQPQPTGGFQPQLTAGLQPQLTGFQPQQTGLQPQATGLPLQAQPTGKPGEWGFVHTPTGGLPGLNAMQNHFLPSAQLSSNSLQNVMGGSLKDNVTWAITKQEKSIYDGVFAAWDKTRKGYIDGDVAISIFNKSGLSRPDLETIWNLCDSNNRGKLNKDEFAVAMHLVYRRLNGLEIPLRLPPELVPPSAKLLQDSMDSLKTSLKGGSARKASAPSKPSSSATRFKNDDDNISYTSSSRHRSRNPTEKSTSSVKSSSSKDLSIEDLKKLVREKKILLDAADSEDQHNSIAMKRAEENNTREIESMKVKIREFQSQLDSSFAGGSDAERAALFKTLNHLTKNSVPKLISKIFQVTSDIAKAKSELTKKNLKRQYPDWNPESSEAGIEATGPNGEITDSDRRKFKSKQLLRQRMAALTGKSYSEGSNSDAELQWKQSSESAEKEREAQSAMIRDIETSIKELEDGASVHLEVSTRSELGSNKWEQGEGVSATMKAFLHELKTLAKPAASVARKSPGSVSQTIPVDGSTIPKDNKPAYSTPEERAAYIKSQAEKRMSERLAKLGISRNRTSTTGSQNNLVDNTAQSKPEGRPADFQERTPKVTPQDDQKIGKVSEKSKDSIPANEPEASSTDNESDEEYAALLKQKKEMERRKREKESKKQEKEARKEKLKREMELMERQNDDWSDDETATKFPQYTPTSVEPNKAEAPQTSDVRRNHSTKDLGVKSGEGTESKSVESPQNSQPAISGDTKPHESNPFSRFGTNKGSQPANSTKSSNTNPFFKPNQGSQPLDQKKLEAQRASQRGLDNDGWSDDEQKSSDEEEPNRAGAAKLATLLFGGMPQPVSRNPTGTFQAKDSKPVNQPGNQPESQPESQHQMQQQPSNLEVSDSGSDDEFATPSPESAPVKFSGEVEVPPIDNAPASTFNQAPPIPVQAPPIPVQAPPIPMQAPPVLATISSTSENDAKSPPSYAPPPPPPPPPFVGPPAPSNGPPPPPGPPPPGPPPPGPPPPGPPPPPSMGLSSVGSSLPKPNGSSDIGALLGQIQGGKSLKKVNDDEKRIADAAVVGRVL